MINFYDIANKLNLASNQVEAIRALLCITEDTYVDGLTLRMYAPDLPAVGVFFPCPDKENTDNVSHFKEN
jgi:hypothetical protein